MKQLKALMLAIPPSVSMVALAGARFGAFAQTGRINLNVTKVGH